MRYRPPARAALPHQAPSRRGATSDCRPGQTFALGRSRARTDEDYHVFRSCNHHRRLRRGRNAIRLVLTMLAFVSCDRAGSDLANAATPAMRCEGEVACRFVEIARGFSQPLYLLPAGDGSNLLYVVEKGGHVKALGANASSSAPTDGSKAEVVLDISSLVSRGSEQGLLSVAFSGRGTERQIYVNYTDRNGDTVVARYPWMGGTARVTGDAEVLLRIKQPFANHNGGLLKFGPEGMLYIGMGDGGKRDDPYKHAQRLDSLLGKMLRIDVRGEKGYTSPPDNPFVGTPGARPEIWAYGLRNPWRFSFDRETGRLIAADVGQDAIEEVHVIERGANLGWPVFEGTACYQPPCDRIAADRPIAEYRHTEGQSVTGGYVYRGSNVAALRGRYIFGDFVSGTVWSLASTEPGATRALLLRSGANPSSFGEDEAGELYLVDFGGRLFRIEAP